jgi:hypothetical protein
MSWLKHNLFDILDVLKFVGILLLVLMLFNLAHENQHIAKQNRSYTRCVATVFAKYTHDFVPVTITNLDKCTVDSSKATPASALPSAPAKPGSVSVAAPQSPSKVFVSSPSPQSAPKKDNTQGDKPQPTPDPSMFQQILNATSDTLEMINPFN